LYVYDGPFLFIGLVTLLVPALLSNNVAYKSYIPLLNYLRTALNHFSLN